MASDAPHIDPNSLTPFISAYRAGSEEAGSSLADTLYPVVLLDVSRFLGDNHPECKDVCQDAIVAGLRYLGRDKEFSGNFINLTVTIARNRCRDILRSQTRRSETDIEPISPFLADPGQSFFEDLDDRQVFRLLQKALEKISETCRKLLKSLYLEEMTTHQVKDMMGLKTVQGVYHRRSVCLAQMKKLLHPEFHIRSGGKITFIEGKKESTHE